MTGASSFDVPSLSTRTPLLFYKKSGYRSKESIYKAILLMPKPSEADKNSRLQKMTSIVKSKPEKEALEEMESLFGK